MRLHRSATRFAAGMLLALLLAGLISNPVPVAAQRDNGITSDTSYESPEFGYEIEWDDPWVADESETESSRDGDSLSLTSDGAFMSVLGFAYTGDPAEAVAIIIQSLEENADDVEVVDESGDDELAVAEVVFDLEGTAVSEYIEARPIGGGASVVVTLTSPTVFYDDEVESAADVIELDGDPIFSAADSGSSTRDRDRDRDVEGDEDASRTSTRDEDEDEDESRTRSRDDRDEDETETGGRDRELADNEEDDANDSRTSRDDEDEVEDEDQDTRSNHSRDDEDEDRNDSRRADDDDDDEDEDEDEDEDRQSRASSGVDGSAYVSPTYGYSLEWDRDWDLVEGSERMGEGKKDWDQVGISNGTTSAFFSGRIDFDGDAAACVDGEADALAATDGIEEVEILTGDDGTPLGVAGEELAFGIYSLVSTMGDAPMIQIVYVECRTVIADEAIVSMVAAMPVDAFETEFESVLALSGALIVDAR